MILPDLNPTNRHLFFMHIFRTLQYMIAECDLFRATCCMIPGMISGGLFLHSCLVSHRVLQHHLKEEHPKGIGRSPTRLNGKICCRLSHHRRRCRSTRPHLLQLVQCLLLRRSCRDLCHLRHLCNLQRLTFCPLWTLLCSRECQRTLASIHRQGGTHTHTHTHAHPRTFGRQSVSARRGRQRRDRQILSQKSSQKRGFKWVPLQES